MSSTTGTRGESVTPANSAFDTVADTTDVTALLERGRALSTPVLRAAVDRLAPPMDTVAAYHFGWIDAQGRPSDGDGGKAVRPALALMSAEAAGAAAEAGIPGAVAVELVHNFSLLHDDLMDGDEQRRHRDTVWKVHGPAQAILVGDALFALANEILLELGTVEAGRATRRLTAASRKLIDGDPLAVLVGDVLGLSVDELAAGGGQAARGAARLDGAELQQDLVGEGEQGVADEDRLGGAVHLPDGVAVAALFVAVHQVVVQEGEVVDEFDGDGAAPEVGIPGAGDLGGEHREGGAHGLAAVTVRRPPVGVDPAEVVGGDGVHGRREPAHGSPQDRR